MLMKQDQKFLLENFATKKDIKELSKQKDLLSVECEKLL